MRNMKIVITKAALAAAMILPCVQAAPVQAAETEKTRLIEVVTSSMATVQEEVKNAQSETREKKAAESRNFGQKIADAAIAQIGVGQDCTMLVTNSLKAVGINFHGAPAAYASLGEWTSDPQPGDVIVYSGHVAVYIGNGKAIHGGWNGGTTIEWTVECSNPLVGYIRVNRTA